jgi:preprotein translocase subunit SecG
MTLSIAQLVSAVILIALIMLQERSSGLSGVFGGGSQDSSYQTRRGLERSIFWATIVMAIIFAGLSALRLGA